MFSFDDDDPAYFVEKASEKKSDETVLLLREAIAYAREQIRISSTTLDNNKLSDSKFLEKQTLVTRMQHRVKKEDRLIGLFMEDLITEVKENEMGNCREFSLLVIDYLHKKGFKGTAVLLNIKGGNHVVVGVNLLGDNPEDAKNWGDGAYICDALGDVICKPAEWRKKIQTLVKHKTFRASGHEREILEYVDVEDHQHLQIMPGVCTLQNLTDWRSTKDQDEVLYKELLNTVINNDIDTLKFIFTQNSEINLNLQYYSEKRGVFTLLDIATDPEIFLMLVKQGAELSSQNMEKLNNLMKSKKITLEQILELQMHSVKDRKEEKCFISTEALKELLKKYDQEKGSWKKLTSSSTKTIQDFKLLDNLLEKNKCKFIHKKQLEACLVARDMRDQDKSSLCRKGKVLLHDSLTFFRSSEIDYSPDDLSATGKFIVGLRSYFI